MLTEIYVIYIKLIDFFLLLFVYSWNLERVKAR